MARTISKPNKYHNEPTDFKGIRFQSKKEARRYQELLLMQRAGQISNLKRQVYYMLKPTQRDDKGKVLFRKMGYKADFVYNKGEKLVVEDAKGYRTPLYKWKRAEMYEKYHILVEEV